jgi:hypothetical protein
MARDDKRVEFNYSHRHKENTVLIINIK